MCDKAFLGETATTEFTRTLEGMTATNTRTHT